MPSYLDDAEPPENYVAKVIRILLNGSGPLLISGLLHKQLQ